MDTTTKADDLRGADKKEAFHREAESRMKPFYFERPDAEIVDRKGVYYLADSDIMMATVQIIPEGGDNRLHYHPGADGFWMVLQGRIRFYGPDSVIGEFGKYEGVLMPRNARYWFESADTSVELHLLYVTGMTQQKVQNFYVPVGEYKPKHQKNLRFNYPEGFKMPE